MSRVYCPTCRTEYAFVENPPYSVVHRITDDGVTHHHPITGEDLSLLEVPEEGRNTNG